MIHNTEGLSNYWKIYIMISHSSASSIYREFFHINYLSVHYDIAQFNKFYLHQKMSINPTNEEKKEDVVTVDVFDGERQSKQHE